MDANLQFSPVGVESGHARHWDHTFYAEVALLETGTEIEDKAVQDGSLVNPATGIEVPINVNCVLSRYALAMKGDDGIGLTNNISASIFKNGVLVDTVLGTAIWDTQTHVDCGRTTLIPFAPCDTLHVDFSSDVPLASVSNVKLRLNLGFQLQ